MVHSYNKNGLSSSLSKSHNWERNTKRQRDGDNQWNISWGIWIRGISEFFVLDLQVFCLRIKIISKQITFNGKINPIPSHSKVPLHSKWTKVFNTTCILNYMLVRAPFQSLCSRGSYSLWLVFHLLKIWHKEELWLGLGNRLELKSASVWMINIWSPPH